MIPPVRERVFAIVAAGLLRDPAGLAPDTTLAELGLDSLSLVEAIFAIEEEFGISVPFNANTPEEPGLDISSLGAMAAAVERLVAAQGRASA